MPALTKTCIGIDVGASAKGFHAVALRGKTVIDKARAHNPAALAAWCVKMSADIVAVDAPCRWRPNGAKARAAERELAAAGISSFSTPTETKGRSHEFYRWMVAGHALYEALTPHYPIYTGDLRQTHVAIESFPQAVACALAGEMVSAKSGKLEARAKILYFAGIPAGSVCNLDEVDAALCALAGQSLLAGRAKCYGEAASGFIVVPDRPLPGLPVYAKGAPPPAVDDTLDYTIYGQLVPDAEWKCLARFASPADFFVAFTSLAKTNRYYALESREPDTNRRIASWQRDKFTS